MKTAYVYALVDPRDQRMRYVGKANVPLSRLVGHFRLNENGRKDDWIKELKDEGLTPYIKVLEQVSGSPWHERERYWVMRLLDEGCDLLNINLMPQARLVLERRQSTLIGMREASERMGVTPNAMRLALINADVPLVRVSARAFAVEEADLVAFIAKRGQNPGRGRPPGAKNKPKSD